MRCNSTAGKFPSTSFSILLLEQCLCKYTSKFNQLQIQKIRIKGPSLSAVSSMLNPMSLTSKCITISVSAFSKFLVLDICMQFHINCLNFRYQIWFWSVLRSEGFVSISSSAAIHFSEKRCPRNKYYTENDVDLPVVPC